MRVSIIGSGYVGTCTAAVFAEHGHDVTIVDVVPAKVEALKAGYEEAILLSPQGYVSECTGENLFIVKGGRLLTPPVAAGALEGITQDTVTTIARDHGYEVAEAHLLRTDLYLADEAFLTGTAAEVVPIRAVDDREIGEPGPITRAIQDAFFATVRGEVDQYKDWVEHVHT
jgi:branched-chain amino acid aminotransferase